MFLEFQKIVIKPYRTNNSYFTNEKTNCLPEWLRSVTQRKPVAPDKGSKGEKLTDVRKRNMAHTEGPG